MKDENNCTTCGHDKWSHAISLKGEVGACMRETIKGWSWCYCEKFAPPIRKSLDKARVRARVRAKVDSLLTPREADERESARKKVTIK